MDSLNSCEMFVADVNRERRSSGLFVNTMFYSTYRSFDFNYVALLICIWHDFLMLLLWPIPQCKRGV